MGSVGDGGRSLGVLMDVALWLAFRMCWNYLLLMGRMGLVYGLVQKHGDEPKVPTARSGHIVGIVNRTCGSSVICYYE